MEKRLNVSIIHASEGEIIAMLEKFTAEVVKAGKLPAMQVLQDSTQYCAGSVYTVDTTKKVRGS